MRTFVGGTTYTQEQMNAPRVMPNSISMSFALLRERSYYCPIYDEKGRYFLRNFPIGKVQFNYGCAMKKAIDGRKFISIFCD